MKISASRDLLLEGLLKVQSIVSPRSSLPILSNVLLQAEDGKILLTATDLEVTVQTSIIADVTKKGGTTLPAKRLVNMVRELSADQIEIETNEQNVATCHAGSSNFKLLGMSESDYPGFPEFKGNYNYTMEQQVFKDMLRSTSYAASTDESRYVLNGVLLSFKEDRLTVVATDGRRLALIEQDIELPAGSECDFVIPSKTVNELIRGLGTEGTLNIRAADNQIAFDFNDILIVSKLIEGTYPNFRQVIPASSDERIAIERESLLHAVKRVSVITSEQSNSVKMSFGKNRLELITETPEVGEARETIPIKYNGKEINVGFNPEFLMAPLRILESDEVAFEVTDDLSPGVLKSDIPFLYVLMPVRTPI